MSTEEQFEHAKMELEKALAGYPRNIQIDALNKAMEMVGDVFQKQERTEIITKLEQIAALDDLFAWSESLGTLTLERNDCSRLHKLKEAVTGGHVIDGSTQNFGKYIGILAVQQTFVVKHDWAAAFANAEGMGDDDFHLPYEVCAFEFRIYGKSIIVVAFESDHKMLVFLDTGENWYSYGGQGAKETEIIDFLFNQIKSICIALDADVATHTVIRASVKLNEKRAKSGKIPLLDYRVVDLSRRHRIANISSGNSGTKKRLHFRRGHWRHYDESKTWVKWCLVGDPDLGFIAKHYTL